MSISGLSRQASLHTAASSKSVSTEALRAENLILSLDGGGIRGIIAGMILKEIERVTEQPIARSFRCIGGTSTGGIIALGLSIPKPDDPKTPLYSAEEVLKLYTDPNMSRKIFQRRQQQNILQIIPPVPIPSLVGLQLEDGGRAASITICGKTALKMAVDSKGINLSSDFDTVNGFLGPKFEGNGIEQVLQKKFGNTPLSKLIPDDVLIPAYNTTLMRHHIFTKHAALANHQQNLPAWQVARATSAAPTYFPPYRIGNHEFIDGGVCMNNPTVALILQAKKLRIAKRSIFCLSIGTGDFFQPLSTERYGMIDWAQKIFEVASLGATSQTEEFARSLIGEHRYARIQPKLPSDIPLDQGDPSTITQLEEIALKAVKENQDILDTVYRIIDLNKKREALKDLIYICV
jgi:uncharacterized protein